MNETRNAALQAALALAHDGIFSDIGTDEDRVLEAAEKFRQFLDGES